MTDPIADMLTRIRNAMMVRHKEVEVPASKLKRALLEILKREGYIKDFSASTEGSRVIKVQLKPGSGGKNVITDIKRISKPGKRVYVNKGEIPAVLGGLGIAVISTSKGLITDKEARKQGVGGELVCTVY
uniref:Small ribosomal subunit protein uS8 n=2 Tax=environmental samples TaxID=34033 RepID=A0A0H4T5M5_9DELT|nr:30S ribosomal protein S8, small subunit ribosomal protein S8 [uncultured delta proteobacterium Rifle_16ft_4_minimus_37851]AKQ05354.1 30S ribosomal protein S8, small subunit ribosomal protein S8 [uncultured delta proteobacterium Rifle_16ft_4_minimus_27247]